MSPVKRLEQRRAERVRDAARAIFGSLRRARTAPARQLV